MDYGKRRLFNRAIAGLTLLIPMSALAATAQAPNAIQTDYLHLKKVEIVDQRGFEKPMVAKRLLAFNDWQVYGGIHYQPNQTGCGVVLRHDNWVVASNNQLSGISQLPQETWKGTSPTMQELMASTMQMTPVIPGFEAFFGNTINLPQDPCANVTTVTPRQLLDDYLARHRPGFRMLDYRVHTAMTEVFNKEMSQFLQFPGMQINFAATVTESLLAGDVNGTEVRELLRAIFVQAQSDMVTPMLNGPVNTSFYQHQLLNATVVRMPAGQLDYALADKLMLHIQDDPAYNARLLQVQAKIADDNRKTWQKINQINARGIAERSRMNAESQAKINSILNETSSIVASTQTGSSDYIRRETTEAILGIETYNDPINGGTVELDNSFNYAWQVKDGSFILSNDANFNPNVDLRLDATSLTIAQ